MRNSLLAILSIMAFLSCKKDDEVPSYSLNETEVTLHYDETFKFTMSDGSSTIDPNRLTYFSSNESVGTIDDEGEFKAKTIGETTVTAKGPGTNQLTANVVVEPYYTLYREPNIDFGVDIRAVKEYESRELIAETATSLLYAGDNENVEGVTYLFDGNKLTAAIVILPSEDESFTEKVATFYLERYKYEGESDGVFFFSDANNGVIIGVGIMETFGLTASYFREGSAESKAISGLISGGKPDIKSLFIK